MAGFVQSHGLQLVDRSGQAFDPRKLTAADVVAFYFSAHWCPPCTHFTPLLKKFAETLQSYGEASLKIIFVSSDKSEPEMWKYIYEAHGDWLALAYSAQEAKQRLERQFQVSGIPSLVVIDPLGRQAVRDARGEVMASAQNSTQVLTTYLRWKAAAGATGVPAAPAAVAPGELPAGLRVRIRGLTGAAEHNGVEGVIKGYSREKGRYVVDLDDGDRSLSLRAANLLQLLPLRVRAADEGHACNGGDAGGEGAGAGGAWTEGVIEDFDDEAGEIVFTAGGNGERRRGHLASTASLVLLSGARVVVHGLQAESARRWNDQLGEVVEFDEVAGRYVIQMSPSAQLKIKPANMRLWPLV